MKRLWSVMTVCILLAVFLPVIIIGCKKIEEKPKVTSYKIGVAAPFTGQYSEYGDMVYNGAKLKVDQVNEAGGIDGVPVVLVKGDELCDPKEAAIIAQ